MMSGVRCICVLEHDADEPAVAHSATDVVNRARLRLAAWMLSTFRHPGVVQLVSVDDGDGSTSLRTRFVGSRTLETTPPLSSVVLAANAAAIAQVIADLHGSGITHGAIEPSHVLLSGPGRPILCGFGRGVLKADCSPAVWAEATRDDVRQLRDMIEMLSLGLSPLSDVAAGRRIREIRRRHRLRRQLKFANPGTIDARELASRFAIIAPTHPHPIADSPSRAHAAPDRHDPPRVARRLYESRTFQIALFLAGATCVGVGAQSVRSGASDRNAVHAARSSSSTSQPSRCPAPRLAAKTAPAAGSISPIDIDGDGCADEVSISGRKLTVNGSTYSIGKDGDQIYFGDWNGDGISTPALLRPHSGAVFFFNVWPSPGTPLDASATAHVIGARGARVVSTAAGRAHLVVQRNSGPDVPVHFRTPAKGAPQP